MTDRDVLEIVEWMVPRWPEVAAWEPAELRVFFDDLAAYSAGSVLSALSRLYRAGRERAPRAGLVLAMLRELDIRPERALPAPRHQPEPTMTWDEYSEVHLGGRISLWEYVKRQLPQREETHDRA